MPQSPRPFLIGGEWRTAKERSNAVLDVRNPFDGSLVDRTSTASPHDLDEALQGALEGFRETSQLASYERSEILSNISRLIHERREDFAQLITAEAGKPIQFSRGEADRAALTFQIASEEAKRIGGEVLPLDLAAASKDRWGIVRRFPIGVILAISPFNFPLNLVAHKVAPAIASGNAFILKPPSQAPLTSLLLGEIILAAGFPKKGFSVVPCSGASIERLVRDDRIAMVTFTGSPAVGWPLKERAGRKRVVLELGGNAGVIVDQSADLEAAVKKNVLGAFVYAGQVCIKVQRVYVHQSLYDRYVERFVQLTKTVGVGDPKQDSTVVGPVIDDAAAERIEAWIREARDGGARVLVGGERKGRVIPPTVLVDVSRDMKVFAQEVFGPVVTLHRFSTIEEAVAGVNDSAFGLQAGIFSNDFRNILYAYRHLEVGGVIVNDNATYRIDHMPYGGVKQSGFGREGLKYAINEMTEPRLLAIHTL